VEGRRSGWETAREFFFLFPLLLAGLLLAAVFAFLFPLLGFVIRCRSASSAG
jgi:hypothetical protein